MRQLTQFIFRCRPRGVGVEPLLNLLEIVTRRVSEGINPFTQGAKTNARYALLLALGEFTLEEIPESRRGALLTQLADWYANEESAAAQPGDTGQSHGDESSQPKKPPATPAGDPGKAESPPEPLPAKNFCDTFVVFRPGEYRIGSPIDEVDRVQDETRHPVTLTRPFAVLDREVTMEELIAFSPQYKKLRWRLDPARGMRLALAETSYC